VQTGNLDLKAIESFVELAADLSFTRAAIRLQITQPQLSNRVKGLEQRIGFRLFDRTSRSVRLTAAGERFLIQARILLAEAANLQRLAEEMRFGIRSNLRITAVEYFQPLRRELLKKFRQKHPAIAVEVEASGRSPYALAAIAEGRFDAAFLLQPRDKSLPAGFDSILLSRQPGGLLVRADSPRIEDGYLDAGDLRQLTVGIFRRDMSPELYDEMATFFQRRAAAVVLLPEATAEGVLLFAGERNTGVACVKWWDNEAHAPDGFRHCLIDGLDTQMDCLLVRSRGESSPALSALWRVAERQVLVRAGSG
jgi:DNA-binding transcriptional LysR family regulator